MRFSQVETYWLYPVFSPVRPAPRNLSIRLYKRTRVTRMQNTAPWPLERFSCARMLPALPGFWEAITRGQCKCCAENHGTRSRWPESNRQHRILLLRFLQLSYSGICAAGRRKRRPRRHRERRLAGPFMPASLLSSWWPHRFVPNGTIFLL